jgi:hypothetical protein
LNACCSGDDESTVDVAGWLSGLGRNHDSQNIEVRRDGSFASSRIESTKHTLGWHDDQTIPRNDDTISGHRPLFRQEPDLTFAPGIETNQNGNAMMSDDPAGLTRRNFSIRKDRD